MKTLCFGGPKHGEFIDCSRPEFLALGDVPPKRLFGDRDLAEVDLMPKHRYELRRHWDITDEVQFYLHMGRV
jgi:hypothetical protein